MDIDPRGRVFVSYRQSDGQEYAREVACALEAAGVPVWRDEQDLPPGEIDERLRQALARPLAGAVLVVTPEMAKSTAVPFTELPRLLALAENPAFTFSVVSAVAQRTDPQKLDYAATDRLLRLPTGTLGGAHTRDVRDAAQRAMTARWHARRRLELLGEEIRRRGALTVDVQTRLPRGDNRDDRDLVIRLPPPPAGDRLPPRAALDALRSGLASLEELLPHVPVPRIEIHGGAHLSCSVALGATIPATKVADVGVVDAEGAVWRTMGARAGGGEPLLRSETEPCAGGRRPVLVYLNLSPDKRPAAYEDLLAARRTDFSATLRLSPARSDRLDPADCGRLVAEASQAIRDLAGHQRTSEVHLLPHCPFPMAVHLGRALNTLRVHVYEWTADADGDRYVPALLVTPGQGQPVERVLLPTS